MGRIRRQRGAPRGGRGNRHPAGGPRQSAVDPGVRHIAGVRQSVRAGNHAQSRTRVFLEAGRARAGDLERLGACALQMGVGCGGRRNGLLEHQPRGHRSAADRVRAVSTVVVYVHGLWQRGAESLWLRRRLSQDVKAEARAFSYPSVAADATTNARALAKYLTAIRADTLHLVGHSLGGLVILKLFEEDADARARLNSFKITRPPRLKLFEEDADARARLPPGRIVLLGPPLRGSRTAEKLARLPFGKTIMGRAVGEELLVPRGERRRWNGTRELGVIAGDLGIGLGCLVGPLGGASDGTVLVEETELDGADARLVLRGGHPGKLFSAAVAHAAGAFLSTGRFSR